MTLQKMNMFLIAYMTCFSSFAMETKVLDGESDTVIFYEVDDAKLCEMMKTLYLSQLDKEASAQFENKYKKLSRAYGKVGALSHSFDVDHPYGEFMEDLYQRLGRLNRFSSIEAFKKGVQKAYNDAVWGVTLMGYKGSNDPEVITTKKLLETKMPLEKILGAINNCRR